MDKVVGEVLLGIQERRLLIIHDPGVQGYAQRTVDVRYTQ